MAYPSETALTTLANLKSYLDPSPQNGISQINVTAGGSGFTSTPSVAINDPTGTGAVASAAVTGNAVTAIAVTSPGKGYSNPSVVISGGGGSGATATAVIGADALLSALITRASSLIVQLSNVPVIFDSGSNITEKRNGSGKSRIITNVAPIRSVTSVTITPQAFGGYATGSLQPTVIPQSDGSSAGWLNDDHSIYLVGGYCFWRGVQNVTLVYRAGEATDGSSTIGNMLEYACLATCALWWKRRVHIDQNSIAAPSGLGSLNFNVKDLPAEAWTAVKQMQRTTWIDP